MLFSCKASWQVTATQGGVELDGLLVDVVI
jgi:hypothetical protein